MRLFIQDCSKFRAVLIVFLWLPIWPRAASSQISHADSVLARGLATLVKPFENGQVILSGDSMLRPLLAAAPQAIGLSNLQFFIETLSATIEDRDSTHLEVSVQGSFLRPGEITSRRQLLTGKFDLVLGHHERELIEHNRDPFVHIRQVPPPGEEESVWSRAIAPILVVAGAVAVVALFFVIRG